MHTGKALRSRHIFPNDVDDPIDGYLLLMGDKVEKIVSVKSISHLSFLDQYTLFDFTESYIFPGLIDTNVHLNSTYEDSWNDVQNTTKMAAQGGITTLIDGPIMHRTDPEQSQTISLRIASLQNKIFVDVGLMAYLDGNFEELVEIPAVMAFKGYLSPPFQSSIPKLNLHTLYKIKKSVEKRETPICLSIACEEANERDLFMASPLRPYEKKMRLDPKVDIKDFKSFGGGHQGVLNDSLSSETSNNEEQNDKVFDLILEANRIKENTSEIKSPTTADLKIVSLLEAKKQDEKYIAEQEYLQYKCGGSFEEESKTFESLSVNILDSSLELSQEISDDFSENSIEEKFLDKRKPSIAKKIQLFADNPLKKVIAKNIQTEKDLGSNNNMFDSQNFANMLYSKQELDSDDKDLQNSTLSIEDYSKPYSQSPDGNAKKKEGILERRLKTKTFIGQDPADGQGKKRSNTTDFMRMRKINTIKEINVETAKDEEKQRCRVYKNFLFNHPLAWENSGINLLLRVFKNSKKCSIHLPNLSSASLAYLIRENRQKNENCPFYSDTSVPHIFFNTEMIKDGQTKFKVSPPIRDKSEEDLIVKSLKKGVFDTVSSFHLQTPINFKSIENGNFRRAFNGISSIGFNLPAVWTRLYETEKLKMKKNKPNPSLKADFEKNLIRIFRVLIRTMSKKPAEIYLLNHQKGDLSQGKDADILVWNPFVVKKVAKEDILLKFPKIFVFRGLKMYGEVVATFLRGEIIFLKDKNGKDFIQRGRLLKRGVNI